MSIFAFCTSSFLHTPSRLAHPTHICNRHVPHTAPISLSSPSPPHVTPPSPPTFPPSRTATITRTTNETAITLTLNLDGTGICDVHTGIPFLDHMLAQLCSHGLFDLYLRAKGDLWIDDHHTNEDIGITLGMAIAKALSNKKGIRRFGHFVAPLDESLVEVVLDFSGRAHCEYALQIPTQRVGTYDTQLVREFYHALAGNAQMTLHVVQRAGLNSHHIIEASFKAFARAIRMAVEFDPRRLDTIPSSKGVLTDAAALDSKSKSNPTA
ncbi:Imidazoleglycerol-phosphate dehydratase [Gracilariopsis chorda]|uniref:Imidazoleglycerol-phosphate dehydratase n=1 Tax=Gracilariopsis chorda TaxID=448386 RepID=A0A2V3J1Q6_9FLOR|nr:Imidazoleglycerol-phosphate dehydratase [Gracilariopsis chorda]|eukprot:PXF48356.1 Imidazoleglycerol-phosphate dehydratase [Gracilariopsis chorda]